MMRRLTSDNDRCLLFLDDEFSGRFRDSLAVFCPIWVEAQWSERTLRNRDVVSLIPAGRWAFFFIFLTVQNVFSVICPQKGTSMWCNSICYER